MRRGSFKRRPCARASAGWPRLPEPNRRNPALRTEDPKRLGPWNSPRPHHGHSLARRRATDVNDLGRRCRRLGPPPPCRYGETPGERVLMSGFAPGGFRLRHCRFAVWAAILIAASLLPSIAHAVDAINLGDASAIDLTAALERPKPEGDRIQVSTAADAEGIVRRIEVR